MAELYNNAKYANSNLVPQYIGSNFESLKDAADRLDTRYRENRDLSNRLAIAMANDKYHEADQHIGDAIHKEFADTIEEVANSDANFENSTGIVANAARDYATNRNRILALENNQKYQQYIAHKQELGAEGQDFTTPFTGTINPDGSTNKFSHKLEKKLDYDKQKETYFNQIEADLTQKGYTQDEINKEFLKSSITGGISTSKIGNYLNEALNRHRTTAEYTQEKRALLRDGYTADQADKEIRRSLLSTGLERVHGISKEDLQRHSEAYLKGMFGQEPNTPPGYEETAGREYKPALIDKSKLTKSFGNLPPVSDFTRAGMTEQEKKAYDKQIESSYNKNDQGYPELTDKEQKKFERIVKHFNPDADKDFMKSDEAYKIVNDYVDKTAGLEIDEKTPIITGDYIRVGEEGRSTREDATKDLAANYTSRTFYNPQTGDKISGSDPKFLKKLGYEDSNSKTAHEQFKSDMEVRGEYSPKNLFTEFAGSDAFVDPIAVTINGKDYAVTRSADQLKGNAFKSHKLVNDAYKALKETPGIENEVTLGGIDFNIGERDDPQHGHVYILETKDGTRQVVVQNLEDLPKALKAEFSK